MKCICCSHSVFISKCALIFVFVLFVFSCSVFSQSNISKEPEQTDESTSPTSVQVTPIADSLKWIIGDWKGTGTQNGTPFTCQLSVSVALDGQSLVFQRSSESGYKELFVVGYDLNSQKFVATLFNNRNHTAVYILDINASEVIFTQVSTPNGFTSKRHFRMTGPGIVSFYIEGANPDQPLKKLVEINFTKKNE